MGRSHPPWRLGPFPLRPFPLGTFSRLGRGAGSACARRRRDEAVPLRPRLHGHQVAVGTHEYGYSQYSPSPLHGHQVAVGTHEYGYSQYSPSPLRGHQVAVGIHSTFEYGYSEYSPSPLRSAECAQSAHVSTRVLTVLPNTRPRVAAVEAAVRTSAPGPAGLQWAHPRLVAHIGTGTAWAHPLAGLRASAPALAHPTAHIGTGTALGSPPRRPAHIRTGTGPPDCPHRHRECDATAQQNVLQQRAPVATASLRECP